jgi:hypothetical protein
MVNLEAGEPNVTSDIQRAIIGGLGGFAAILVKYLSHDHAAVVSYISTPVAALPAGANLLSIVWGYLILTPILIFLGAIIGWVSYERHRVKLFFLGVSAPALVTTLPPVDLGTKKVAELIEPSPALAQSQGNISSYFADGDRSYAIYMGSYTQPEMYNRIIKTINADVKSLHAFTTDFTDRNGTQFKRLFVVQRFSLKEALDVRERLLKSHIVEEAAITASLTEAK